MDLRTAVGSVALRAPVMTASGTAGHGAEFANYLDPASLGAVVVKSMKADEWAGNPAPRVHPTASGMINSVGLQGKGVPHWLEHDLPDLLATGATVVASIWGSSVDDYARAAAALAKAAEARRVRANLKQALKAGELGLADVLVRAESDDVVAMTKILTILEALPGVGKVKSRRTMASIGISESRRVQGLGAKQRRALLTAFGDEVATSNDD